MEEQVSQTHTRTEETREEDTTTREPMPDAQNDQSERGDQTQGERGGTPAPTHEPSQRDSLVQGG